MFCNFVFYFHLNLYTHFSFSSLSVRIDFLMVGVNEVTVPCDYRY